MRKLKVALLGVFALNCANSPTVAAEPNQPTLQTDPQAYVDEAFALLQEHHINRSKVNWDDLRLAARLLTTGSKTAGDTHATLRAILSALNEKHSHLFIPRKFDTKTNSDNLLKTLIEMPQGKLIYGNIAYISVPGLMTVGGNERNGEIYRKALFDLVASLDEGASCGWMIDLRTNPGGNMWPMLNGLDPLLGSGPFGFFVLDDGRIPWIRADAGIMPGRSDERVGLTPSSTLNHADAPLAVLMGPQTTSSGEMVAIALTGRKGSKTFGAATADFTTAVRPFTLSDGAVLGITTSLVAYRDGTIVDGPLIPEQTSDDPESDAAEWLSSVCQSK